MAFGGDSLESMENQQVIKKEKTWKLPLGSVQEISTKSYMATKRKEGQLGPRI